MTHDIGNRERIAGLHLALDAVIAAIRVMAGTHPEEDLIKELLKAALAVLADTRDTAEDMEYADYLQHEEQKL